MVVHSVDRGDVADGGGGFGARSRWVLRTQEGDTSVLDLAPGDARSIGRDWTSDILVVDAGVSRHHAILEFDGRNLWIEDQHSQNGTFLNTEAVRRARVQAGDVLTIGRVSLTVGLSDETEGGESSDPLEGLAREDLLQLLHLSRALREHQSVANHLFHAVTTLAQSRCLAQRAGLFVWKPESRSWRLSYAIPEALDSASLRREMESFGDLFLRENWPHMLPASSRRGQSVIVPVFRDSVLRISAGRGGVVPLGTGGGAVLLLERGRGAPTFGKDDLDFLAALSWMTAGRLEAGSSRLGPYAETVMIGPEDIGEEN